jgi:hypothetical protein
MNGEDRIISKDLWPPRSPDLNPCDFYLWGRLKSVVHTNNTYDLEALKQFTTFSNVNCNKFPEICLKEFRHVSQRSADILNIFYDGDCNINYSILLIINERSKQYVLTVSAAHKRFYRQVTQQFRR